MGFLQMLSYSLLTTCLIIKYIKSLLSYQKRKINFMGVENGISEILEKRNAAVARSDTYSFGPPLQETKRNTSETPPANNTGQGAWDKVIVGGEMVVDWQLPTGNPENRRNAISSRPTSRN